MRKWRCRCVVWILLLVVLSVAALSVITEANLRPILLNTAESRVRAVALDAINSAIAANLTDVQYEDLVTVEKDAFGSVTLLQANTISMNRISTQTALTAQQYIADIGQQPIRISLGSATGNALLAGRGPEIKVNVIPVGAVSTEFITEFQSTGINQTRHKVYLKVTASIRIVIPTGAKTTQVSANMLVAESIIVGSVPEGFVGYNIGEEELNMVR